MKGYTTTDKVADFLKTTIPANSIDDYIEAAEKFIDEYTLRNFKADNALSERIFTRKNVDDFVEISNLYGSDDVTGTFTEITEFVALPLNALADGKSYNRFECVDSYRYYKLNAKWGYSVEVPSDIEFAATFIAAGMFAYNNSILSGPVKSEKIGEYSVTYATSEKTSQTNDSNNALEGIGRIKAILDHYKKFTI